MPSTTFKSNRAYPSLPSPSGDVRSHTTLLELIKQALEIHERRTSDLLNSFVRVGELQDIGLIKINGDQLSNAVAQPDGAVVPHTHNISEVNSLTAVLNQLQSIDAGFDVRITSLEDVSDQARTQRYFVGE